MNCCSWFIQFWLQGLVTILSVYYIMWFYGKRMSQMNCLIMVYNFSFLGHFVKSSLSLSLRSQTNIVWSFGGNVSSSVNQKGKWERGKRKITFYNLNKIWPWHRLCWADPGQRDGELRYLRSCKYIELLSFVHIFCPDLIHVCTNAYVVFNHGSILF